MVSNKISMKKIILIIATVILLSACLATYLALTSTSRKLTKQLDIAHEYMENGDYEKAIAAFTEAIEIDPTSIEAYLGAAEAYVALDDYESAVEILQKGYDVTGSDEIKAKLDEYTAVIEARKAEEARLAEEERLRQEEIAKQVDFDLSLENFTFFGHSVLEGDMLQTIADEYGIPYENSTHDNKYFWDSEEDGRKYIMCPCDLDEDGDWTGHGWMNAYSVEGSNISVGIWVNHVFRDEYYEGPINIGDGIDKVNELINYNEIIEKGELISNDDLSSSYKFISADKEYYFSESKMIDTPGYGYVISTEDGNSYSFTFTDDGIVRSVHMWASGN